MSTYRFTPGDHIQIRETISGFSYYHHGIVVGQGNEVVHFTTRNNEARHMRPVDIFGDILQKMILQKNHISEFGNINEIEVIHYDGKICFPPDVVVQRAEEIYNQYSNLINQRHYVELIERLYDPNMKNKPGDERLLKNMYDQYPEMRFIMRPYHLTEHNCEHIASYIKTGNFYSSQENKSGVKYIKRFAIGVILFCMLIIGLFSFGLLRLRFLDHFIIPLFIIMFISFFVYAILDKGSPDLEKQHLDPHEDLDID